MKEYRASKCPDCAKAGQCKECGCRLPAKFYVADEKCPLGNW